MKPQARWSPSWCMHVEGRFEFRTPDWEEDEDFQRVDMICLCCQAFWRVFCYSGRVDKRIEKFAILHKECWAKPLP